MPIPKLLQYRILNPNEPAQLACTAIAQVSRHIEYPAAEAFELLVEAFIGDARVEIEQAIQDGLILISARSMHTDTIARQIDKLRPFRGDRYARLLMRLLFSKQVPREARITAAGALATHSENDLSAEVVTAAEDLLQAVLNDHREDAEVQRAIQTSFGQPRTARPRLHAVAAERDDATTAL
jgi:hypothetical protein